MEAATFALTAGEISLENHFNSAYDGSKQPQGGTEKGGSPLNMEEMEAVEIAYLRRTGPYGPENPTADGAPEGIPEGAGQDGVRDRPAGIALDDPSRTPPDRCRYDVGHHHPRGGAAPTGHPQGPGRTVRRL